MTLAEIDALLVICRKHGAVYVEHQGFKAQLGPAYDPPMPAQPEETRRKEPDPEAVLADLHLGGGRG